VSRIQRGCAHRILQTPAPENGDVAHDSVHNEDAARELAIDRAPASLDFNFHGAKLVAAIGHASGGGSVGDENRTVEAFRMQEKLHNRGRDMNSVGYDVGAELVIRQHLAEIPGSRWSSGLMALKV